jgi:hypothetical protein
VEDAADDAVAELGDPERQIGDGEAEGEEAWILHLHGSEVYSEAISPPTFRVRGLWIGVPVPLDSF